MTMDSEEYIDDMTMSLQMQQFLDEWHYRVLHSNMATVWDRTQTLVVAMDLFEAHGMIISQDEKWALAAGDEDEMVDALVSKMGPQQRRSFEHFVLQLQLIVSMASRVRVALEEGEAKDVQRIVEDGDKGITQHILKQTVVEAAVQVGEQREIGGSWTKNMARRLDRLSHVAQSTKDATEQLAALTRDLSTFGNSQNVKSQKMLLSMSDANDKTLLKTILGTWHAYADKHKVERDIHDKFRNEIEEMKATLLSYKTARIEGVKKALMSRADASGRDLLREVLRCWAKDAEHSKEERETSGKLKAQEERLASLKDSQKASAKRTMSRLAAGNDSSLRSMCFQSWVSSVEEMRLERQVNGQADSMQAQLKAMKAKSKNESNSVLSRMQGSTGTGFLTQVFTAWAEDFKADKKAREFQAQIAASDQKFSLLKSAQSGKATNVAEQAIQLEKDNLLMSVIMNWHGEVKLQRCIRHYGGKMNAKKQQLDAVRQMFNAFANDLGEISNTPRKHKSASSKSAAPALGNPAGDA